ncbi:hypothetical protein GGR54DRAFT_596576 [Hypoxylon sp. NC1633]|nr:hypothetical protein GGR54DRAFT_596576 [Hypoxylon sp. NC1633]
MSTSRVFSSALRTTLRRVAPAHRQLLRHPAIRRSYASSGHGGSAGAEKSSDLPWLIGSVGITVPAVAWMLSTGPSKKAKPRSDTGHHYDTSASKSESDEGEDSADESSSSSDSSSSTSDEEDSAAQDTPDESSSSSSDSDGDSDSNSDSDADSKPKSKSKNKNKPNSSSLPPPSADNTDPATNADDKKAAHEDYKDMIRRKDTKMASSSSDMPTKRTAGEHPREDPQKGEGEGVQKGGPE